MLYVVWLKKMTKFKTCYNLQMCFFMVKFHSINPESTNLCTYHSVGMYNITQTCQSH